MVSILIVSGLYIGWSMFRWNLDAVQRLNEIVQEQTHMNYVVFEVDMSNAKGNNKPETSHYKKKMLIMATTSNASKFSFVEREKKNIDICVARHFVACVLYAFGP